MIFFRFDDSRKDCKLIRLAILISFIFFSNHVVAQLSSSQEVVALVNKERSRLGLNALNARYGRIGVARVGDVWVQNFSN